MLYNKLNYTTQVKIFYTDSKLKLLASNARGREMYLCLASDDVFKEKGREKTITIFIFQQVVAIVSK